MCYWAGWSHGTDPGEEMAASQETRRADYGLRDTHNDPFRGEQCEVDACSPLCRTPNPFSRLFIQPYKHKGRVEQLLSVHLLSLDLSM